MAGPLHRPLDLVRGPPTLPEHAAKEAAGVRAALEAMPMAEG